ncbi:hypothetical protein HDU78_002018 [Chytriomyces hyalinus]|nr:hypothetical protein HDU78_002018 [Chytriomyces hyalinus]KAJ3258889.1 hypothetical protein HDU77_002117 [Chytriomyces hyalinus]KAJ3396252.1 hypothetical protein HDU80_010040 [Chytriomyces hyalinus]
MGDIDPNELFAGSLKYMKSLGMMDTDKNRLALSRAGGRVQQAIDWILTDTIPDSGADNTPLSQYVAEKKNPYGKDPQRQALKELASMGFTDESLNLRALFETSNVVDDAAAWLIERTGDKETKALFKQLAKEKAGDISKSSTSPSKSATAHGSYPFSSSQEKSYSSASNSRSNIHSQNVSSAKLLDDAFTIQPIGSYIPPARVAAPPAPEAYSLSASKAAGFGSGSGSQFAPQLSQMSISPNSYQQQIPANRAMNPFQSVGPVALVTPKPIDENKFLSLEDLKKKGMLGDANQHQASDFSRNGQSSLRQEVEDEDPFADPFADQ